MPIQQTIHDAWSRLSSRQHKTFICLLLATITIVAYWPVRHFGFVSYDDFQYVYANPRIYAGLTRTNIVWAFTTFHTNNYFPVTWLSFLTDASLFGAGPAGLHVENVLLHGVNSILIFIFLCEATARFWPPAIAAALFAVHPTHVESVAWITERKDVLFMLFFLLAMLSYTQYAARNKLWAYLATMFFFACGLCSKSMLVTFPFVLLLVDYWPLGRLLPASHAGSTPRFTAIKLGPAIVEKIPFFAICVIGIFLGYKAQAAITAPLSSIPLSLRAQNAAVSYTAYLANTVWPLNLSVLIPYRWSISSTTVACDVALLLSLTAAVLIPAHDRRMRAVGWLWFVGTMVPAIGIVQVGQQAMADRFLYLPSIGLSILVIWSVPWHKIPLVFSVAAVVTILILLTILTRRQVNYWANSDLLFHHASIVLNGDAGEELRLGVLAAQRGEGADAQRHYLAALALDPQNYAADFDLGNLLLPTDPAKAIEHYQSAARKQPQQVEVQINWGVALMTLNKPGEAFAHFKRAELIDPDSYDAHYNLGNLFSLANQLPQARAEFSRALKARPDDPKAKQALQAAN